MNGHQSVVEYLVNQKAFLNTKNTDEKTPLEEARNRGHSSIVRFLEENGGQ